MVYIRPLLTPVMILRSSSLASAGSELKLQSTGSGLDDLQEEFMDGRYVSRLRVCTHVNASVDRPQRSRHCSIQYAFARVEDPNVSD